MGCDAFEQVVEVASGVGPGEGLCGEVVAVLEGGQPGFDVGEVVELVRGQDFALYDREEDLDLVEPRG